MSQRKANANQKSSTNITNEIKDLLDKLVAYQGKPLDENSKHSQSVVETVSQGQRRLAGAAESMVELRSSEASSNGYPIAIPLSGKEGELKPPNTARERTSNPIKSSAQVPREGSRKQWAKPNEIQHHQSKHAEADVADSPVKNFSCSSNSSASPDGRPTAKHTSKDTLLSFPARGRGRRYHEVNKSEVITPNSPRRYQDYFKNRLHPTVEQSTALPATGYSMVINQSAKQVTTSKAKASQ